MTQQNRPSISIASDYATLHAKNADFYYGYEEEDEEGNWCFVATFDDNKIVIPSTKLGVRDDTDTAKCLLAGIGWILAKYRLTFGGDLV
jgi:hypothetical protein